MRPPENPDPFRPYRPTVTQLLRGVCQLAVAVAGVAWLIAAVWGW